jgi:hypothetical protein
MTAAIKDNTAIINCQYNSVTGDNLSPVTMKPEINLLPELTTTQAIKHVEIRFGKNLSSIRATQ